MELEKLAAPFGENEVEWRVQASGSGDRGVWARCMPFIDSRCIMDRLDAVCGIGAWQNRYEKGPDCGTICGISIRIDNEWVTKWDGAETPGASTGSATENRIDAVKTGLTNAFKRAAVQWGIGRYLYGIPAGYAVFCDDGKYQVKIQGRAYRWNPPGASTPLSDRKESGVRNQESGEKQETGDAMRGATEKRKAVARKEKVWEYCLIIAGGDIEAAKKVLHGYAGIYNWERLYDSKAEQIFQAVKREAEEKGKKI